MKKLKIVAIGAGNVATHLIPQLYNKGHGIEQVYSRQLKNAKVLAKKVAAEPISSFTDINPNADIYFFMLPDDKIAKLAAQLKGSVKKSAVLIHSSGSVSSKVLKSISSHYGVLYPLQSFTKAEKVQLLEVPIFINGNTKIAKNLISALASNISDSVVSLSDKKRKELHLAAVVCNNFVHHLFVKSDTYLKEKGVAFRYLLPLIKETLENAEAKNLMKKQTGPAKRNDNKTIKEHLKMLESDQTFRKLYALFSKSIKETNR